MSDFYDQESAVTDQKRLLHTYRSTLAHYLHQRAELGSLAPPGVSNGIKDARFNIARIKDILRKQNVQVDDDPFDEEQIEDYKAKEISVKLSQYDRVLLSSLCSKTAIFCVLLLGFTAFVGGYIFDSIGFKDAQAQNLGPIQLGVFIVANLLNSIAIGLYVTWNLHKIDRTFGVLQATIFCIGRFMSSIFGPAIFIGQMLTVFLVFRLKDRPVSLEKTLVAVLGHLVSFFAYSAIIFLVGQVVNIFYHTTNFNEIIGYRVYGPIVGFIQGALFAYIAAGTMYWQALRQKIQSS